ncbi:hypothetical protein Mgra_00002464 [Meloidogyne graminicola]|uniref:Uncharacterized protein n=1 Tax=Meloidogyne graminicola TaxID=189291 RepID=A0A8S9ZWG1_9BILA|nr:hypothetical protein Mgra_00002464 [Meloidogyne graminicola]
MNYINKNNIQNSISKYLRPNSEIRYQQQQQYLQQNNNYYLNNLFNPQCLIPSDFWCDNSNIILAFESGCPDSQKLIVNRLYNQILNNSEFIDLINFNAFPWGLSKRLLEYYLSSWTI